MQVLYYRKTMKRPLKYRSKQLEDFKQAKVQTLEQQTELRISLIASNYKTLEPRLISIMPFTIYTPSNSL